MTIKLCSVMDHAYKRLSKINREIADATPTFCKISSEAPLVTPRGAAQAANPNTVSAAVARRNCWFCSWCISTWSFRMSSSVDMREYVMALGLSLTRHKISDTWRESA